MKLVTVIFAFMASTSAFAGGYIEPYVGYETGKVESTGSDEDVKGMTFGGKLGYSQLGLALGVDYMKGDLKIESSPSVDFDTTDMGAFIQYTFPILLKVSGTYFLSSEAEIGTGGELKGKGYKIGAGFTGFPFITLNLDMINVNYDEIEGSNVNPDIDRKTYMLSVGLPFNF